MSISNRFFRNLELCFIWLLVFGYWLFLKSVIINLVNKFKTFFHVLIKSHSSPSYYKDLLPTKFSFSLKYFYLYFVFYALIGTVYIGIIVAPPVSRFLSVLPQKVIDMYPDELVVTVKNGEVSTNVVEPYTIPLTRFEEVFDFDNVLGTDTESMQNLVVIDTNAQVEDYVGYSTLVLITKKTVVWSDDDGTHLYNLTADDSFTLTKAEVTDFVNQVKPLTRYVIPAMVVAAFLGLFLFVPSGYLIYLLFFALLFWLLSKILKTGLTYKGSYKLGLHLATVYATISGLFIMVKVPLSFPFLRTIFLLVFGFFVLRQISASPAPAPAQPETPTPNIPTV